MAMIRLASTFCCTTAAVAMLTMGSSPAPGSEVQESQAGCASASFNVPRGSPFGLTPKAGGRPGRPRALVSGSFARRSGVDSGCRCDLAISVAAEDNAEPDFLMLMKGNSDGSFVQVAEVPSLEVGKNPLAIAAGPFKKDAGGLDSVVVVSSGSTGPGTVTIFAPDKDTGEYARPAASPTTWQTGVGAIAVATGDFNGDTNLDAAIANRDRSVTILFGNGAGSFEPKPLPVTGIPGIPSSITAGRFSGPSGPVDIALAITTDAPSRRSAIVIVHGKSFSVDPPIPVGETGSAEPWIATANLSDPQAVVGRDLVVGFTDFKAAQQPVGRIKVLLGNGPGGTPNVSGVRTIEVGPRRIRSIAIDDFDNDRAVDLAVSTFGDTGSGSIELFQGRTSGSVGFHENDAWKDRPSTRPRWLAAGRFGPRSGDERSLPHVGLAFVNEALPEVGVFLGSGGGAFAQPEVVTMEMDPQADLFATGDFHTPDGSAKFSDVAYVTTNSEGRRMLTVLLSTGAGGFTTQEIGVAGTNPTLIATGAFTETVTDTDPKGKATDIAIVDVPPSGVPVLKIFVGDGTGKFKLSPSEFPLGAGDAPIVIAADRFRGHDMPIDIAIFRGEMLHVLTNDGGGRFTASVSPMNVHVRAGAVVTSNTLRPPPPPPPPPAEPPKPPLPAPVDMIVRDAKANRFVFLVNITNGQFRFATERAGVFADAGNVDSILLGDLTGDKLDDVVTFDDNMAIRVFKNLGPTAEGFAAVETSDKKPINPLGDRKLTFSLPRYFLKDFGEGKLGLAAAAVLNNKTGLAMLHGNGAGGFTATTKESPTLNFTEFDRRPAGEEKRETTFVASETVPTATADLKVTRGFADQFRNEQLGNGRPDLLFISTLRTVEFAAGNCPGDTQPTPPNPRPRLCPPRAAFECPPDLPPLRPGEKPRICSPAPEVECCSCAFVMVDGVRAPACPGTCNTPELPPFRPYCRTTRERHFLAVYANSCTK